MDQKKPVDRRMQIVEAARQSFAMFGYKATTMELVSKIAAVGKGTIYTFFPTKEDLFSEIINQFAVSLRLLRNVRLIVNGRSLTILLMFYTSCCISEKSRNYL